MSHAQNFTVAPHGGNLFLRIVGWLSTICGLAAAALIVAAVTITCQMIYVRYVNNESTVWQTEAVIYLMVGATLIGLPYVQRLRGHVNVDLIPLMLPMGVRKMLALLVCVASIVIIAIMLFYSWEMWHLAFERGWKSDTVWGPPLWIPYSALLIGFGVYLLQLIGDLVGVWTGVEAPFGLEDESLVDNLTKKDSH